MIKLEAVHIEEVRGIRKLDINFGRKTFAISGPNGSGKSGVIDAIEFGLTGQIGRLAGAGTKSLSIAEHGPHVDKTKFPDAAFVELQVFLPDLGKSATITRKVGTPKKPKILPDDDDVIAAFEEIADHPEVTLSRREVLRFILVEPSKRSQEIQALLKLEDIGETRAALNTARNRLETAHRTATAQATGALDALQRHLQIPTVREADILEAVNQRRRVLTLPEIADLTPDTKLDAGLSSAENAPGYNKKSALDDLKALSDAEKRFEEMGKEEAARIVRALGELDADNGLLAALQQRTFIETGLAFVDAPACPLCDLPWDEQSLRQHLNAKLSKSEHARGIQESLQKNGAALGQHASRVAGLLVPVQRLAEAEGDHAFGQVLILWKASLETLKGNVGTVEGLRGVKDRLDGGWLQIPGAFSTA